MQNPWKVVFAFVSIFIAGAVFGGFFALRIGQEVVQRNGGRPTPPALPPLGIQILRRFAERLDLTDEQREKVRPKVLHAEEQLAKVRRLSLEQTEEILNRVQTEFRAELTPEQRRKLDRLEQNQRETMKQERAMKGQQQGGFGPEGLPPGKRPFNPNQQRLPNGGPRPNPNQSFPNQPGPNGQPYRNPPPQNFPPQNTQNPSPVDAVPGAVQPPANNPPPPDGGQPK